jgi:hypothetical protein
MLEAVGAASWPWFGPISNKGTPLLLGILWELLINFQLLMISASL